MPKVPTPPASGDLAEIEPAIRRLQGGTRVWSRPFYEACPQIRALYYDSCMHENRPSLALCERAAGAVPERPSVHRALSDHAHEFPQTHITAVAPGIIDTAMMDHPCEEADAESFPALQRLRQARGTEAMPGPLAAAERLISTLPRLKDWPSGRFVDIREILDPAAYARLYGNARK